MGSLGCFMAMIVTIVCSVIVSHFRRHVNAIHKNYFVAYLFMGLVGWDVFKSSTAFRSITVVCIAVDLHDYDDSCMLYSAAKSAVDERKFQMVRQAQERKIRESQSSAVAEQQLEERVRGSEAKSKALKKQAAQEAREAFLRARDLDVELQRQRLQESIQADLVAKKAMFLKETARHDKLMYKRDFVQPYAAAVSTASVEKARYVLGLQ